MEKHSDKLSSSLSLSPYAGVQPPPVQSVQSASAVQHTQH